MGICASITKVVLVPPEVGVFIEYPVATFHPDGVAAAKEGAQIGTLRAALIGAASEVPLLVKDDLCGVGEKEHVIDAH
ncbi:hypothetical protein NDU88_003579 [Pleurodeles waltl]|uniref:Uncharacterized protein n=1 Tax=Pleurodeles waltl TaxID=8319 RepID=A0AAV7UCF9_PLEWA|nr:hypothetical protein NDU88_003579 [Pleurodeles waltl]